MAEALAWARKLCADGPFLIYASAPPDEVKPVQAALGRERAGALVEHALARARGGLVERRRSAHRGGGRRNLGRGGAGAGRAARCASGRRSSPAFPATLALGEPGLALALKSGNFGAEDFFLKAIERLP